MAKLTRWDNGETIHETDGDIRATVESAAKLVISCFRANLRDANLRDANLRDANLHEANLRDANLHAANLSDTNLRDAKHVTMHSRWEVSFTESPSLVVHIGCKTKSIAEWDAIFERIGESMNIALSMFESPELGSNDDARKIRANYMAIRAYLVALGKHEVAK